MFTILLVEFFMEVMMSFLIIFILSSEWALCQRGALSHLQPNSCVVQYKIVLGGNQQPQNQSAGSSGGDRYVKKDPQVK